MSKHPVASVGLILLSALLVACGGGSSNSPPSDSDNSGGGGTEPASFFQANLSNAVGFCRTCHIPGGVADVEDGRGLMLSANAANDFDAVYAAWETLGRGVLTNPLIVETSDNSEPHSGGKPWPVGSASYEAMKTLLSCWDNPNACSLSGGGGSQEELLPLLGSARGGHVWFDYCADNGQGSPRADSAVLPADPRSLVLPGVSEGRAVAFNAFWKDCHIDPELVGEYPHPETCGELRQSYAKGVPIMEGNGQLGAATTFAGQKPHGLGAISADQYNQQWLVWGLTERPDNFDELVAERHGFGPVLKGPGAPRNPYPLPGEDPNATNGGSGTLPQGLTQTRNEDGSYSGYISANCQGCHSVPVETADGVEYYYGAGGAMLDASTSSRDWGALGVPGSLLIDRAGFGGRVRGTNNAQFANVVALLGTDFDAGFIDVLTNGATATGDTPAWWNVGRRPVKFVDAMFPGDAVRVDFALYFPLLDTNPLIDGELPGIFNMDEVEAWMSENVQAGDLWIMSQKSPEYPGSINTSLAEQGAVLFHTKDLWAEGNAVPRPSSGNGSCASCHGAYSPRYVNDPSFLASPELEGIASYVTPIEIIGTDRVRLDTFNFGTNDWLSNSFVGYPETENTAQDCRVQNLPGQQVDAEGNERPKGYAAPPLYGIWATAPYFHNGSVPSLTAVLDSSARPDIWRRVSKPARADQEGDVVMGFDYNFARAYDQENVGWDYDELQCGGNITLPYLDCSPLDPLLDPLYENLLTPLLSQLFGNITGVWNITNPPIFSNADIEARKIYNTGMFSQGNGGHVFSDVLSDQERKAIIEYLKTL
jgi:endo-cleaving rubber dioxygenase